MSRGPNGQSTGTGLTRLPEAVQIGGESIGRRPASHRTPHQEDESHMANVTVYTNIG
jgi:hypothetical protein